MYPKDSNTNVKGILATFGTTPDALLDVVTGKFNPTGKMPFTTPVSEKAVQQQKEDVPGYEEGPAYPLSTTRGSATKELPSSKLLISNVIPSRLELETYCLEGSCSIRLSYGTG